MRRSRNSAPPTRRSKVDVSPVRVALAAVRRIREVGYRLGSSRHVDQGVGAKELAAREAVIGRQLPPSYVAVVRHVTDLGPPDELLDAGAMTMKVAELRRSPAGARYLPFATSGGKLLCFDSRGEATRADGELAVVAFTKGYGTPVARSFAEWLDAVADRREERLAAAANVPPRLKKLLRELGFSFAGGLSAQIETADSDAVELLVGEDVVDELLANGSLYDSTGKALLLLQLDDFSMRVRLREGFVDVGAEHVFPWLRSFRDEDFFAPLAELGSGTDLENEPTQTRLPDHVRDLQRAERREPPRTQGSVALLPLAAQHHTFLDATGSESEGVYLLGRVNGSLRSLILRIDGTTVVGARYVDEPLTRLHLTDDGALWAMGGTYAHRFYGFEQERFGLVRPTEGATNWLDIGGIGDRVLVWGAGALLGFDGKGFSPFVPDLALHPLETVLAVQLRGERISALVVREKFGAIAHFDGVSWLPIAEESLVAGTPTDLHTFAGQEWVLEGQSVVYTQSESGAPRPVAFSRSAPAFTDASGRPRPFFDLLPGRSGLLLSSLGGFLFAPTRGEPSFFRGHGEHLRGRLVRIEECRLTLALLGGAVWVHEAGAFHPLDLTQF